MDQDYSITPLQEHEIPDLRTFAMRTFTDTFQGTCTDEDLENFLEQTYSVKGLRVEFLDKNSEVWILKRGENWGGFIKINFSASLPSPQVGKGLEIQRLYVDKPYHGLGYGKILMNFAEKMARLKKEKSLWLGVWEHNEKAKNFYEKLGFRYFGSHPFPIGNTPQMDLWMVKELFYD